jgi:low affinity Fe/Cu permease
MFNKYSSKIHTFRDEPTHYFAFICWAAALVCLIVSFFADKSGKWMTGFAVLFVIGIIILFSSMHSKIFNRDAVIDEVLTKALTAKIQLFQKEGKYVGMDAYHMALQILEKDALRGTRDLEDLNLIPILYEEFGDGL